ncbi:MAG: phage major capsid protein [Nitrospiraceae bacterium]
MPMSKTKIEELREKRAAIADQARKLIAKDAQTADDESKFDKMMDEVDKLKDQIDREERLVAVEASLSERIELRAAKDGTSPDEAHDAMKAEDAVFGIYLRQGVGGLSAEQRSIMMRRQQSLPTEIRAAQSAGTAGSGGYTVPTGMASKIEDAQKEFGAMLQSGVAEMMVTENGQSIPFPTSNDTSNVGEQLGENTATAEQDVAFGSVPIDAYMFSSKLVRVSFQLLEDSAFNLENYLAGKLGERIGRIVNQRLTTGTGSGQPNGIVTASVQGKVGANGQTTSIIYNDLVDLEHSVDPSYRRGAKWMFHDSSLKVIKKLLDSQNRPLWMPGIAVGAPDTILGYQYIINQDMATMAANAKSVLFGAISKYLVRRVHGIGLLRLQERYAEQLQVGFIAYQRFDGDLLDAGTNPVKHYANSAT